MRAHVRPSSVRVDPRPVAVGPDGRPVEVSRKLRPRAVRSDGRPPPAPPPAPPVAFARRTLGERPGLLHTACRRRNRSTTAPRSYRPAGTRIVCRWRGVAFNARSPTEIETVSTRAAPSTRPPGLRRRRERATGKPDQDHKPKRSRECGHPQSCHEVLPGRIIENTVRKRGHRNAEPHHTARIATFQSERINIEYSIIPIALESQTGRFRGTSTR